MRSTVRDRRRHTGWGEGGDRRQGNEDHPEGKCGRKRRRGNDRERKGTTNNFLRAVVHLTETFLFEIHLALSEFQKQGSGNYVLNHVFWVIEMVEVLAFKANASGESCRGCQRVKSTGDGVGEGSGEGQWDRGGRFTAET